MGAFRGLEERVDGTTASTDAQPSSYSRRDRLFGAADQFCVGRTWFYKAGDALDAVAERARAVARA